MGGPLDLGIGYFKIVTALLSILTVSSLAGICFFLYVTGFMPEMEKYNLDKKEWEPQGEYHFSILTLCGVIMLSVYFVPFFLRPIDFLFNFCGYILGMFTYILMLPTFITIMQIYSMSNLHDISWGNRPTATT